MAARDLKAMGGDKFVVILTGVTDAHETAVAFHSIVEGIAASYRLDDNEGHVSCSAGACFYPTDGQTADELLRNADTAMCQAKDLGRNNFRFHLAAMNERLSRRFSMENQLCRSLERDEPVLHYKPQIDLRHGGITVSKRWYAGNTTNWERSPQN